MRLLLMLAVAGGIHSLTAQAAVRPASTSYLVFVTSEGRDLITLVRFRDTAATIEHRTPIVLDTAIVAAPHAIRVAPDRRHYYVLTRRGFTEGELLRATISADSVAHTGQPADTLTGREPLGVEPSAVDISPAGEFAWVTLTGTDASRASSAVVVVYLSAMAEVARIPTCAGARGSRLTANGARHYSVCTAADLLVEIVAHTMAVARKIAVGGAGQAPCGPTWAEPTRDGSVVYVACSAANDVAVVSVASGLVTQRIPMGAGLSHLALTGEGKLLVGTNRADQSVSIASTLPGGDVVRIPVAIPNPTGVSISADDKYAFVSVAGDGKLPGSVVMIDLAARRIVASIDVASVATGIDVWKQQP